VIDRPLRQIHNAAQNPVELDKAQADAVDARTILDLRLGAAFTRMQSLILQARFPELNNQKKPISYGVLVCYCFTRGTNLDTRTMPISDPGLCCIAI